MADIKKLLKDLTQLQHEIKNVHAVTACANLMSKYQYYHMKGQLTEETHLFALKSPGARVEMRWGIYDEPESVLRWKRMEGYGSKRKPGGFAMHCITTPIIEVAKDGETAKGLWLIWGAVTNAQRIHWVAGPFAMDFIKEDGEWKIWKYCTMGVIRSPFEKGWHKENSLPPEVRYDNPDRPAEFKPDRPPSYGMWLWNPEELMPLIPPVPLPYETWDESQACVPPPPKKRATKKK